MLFLTIIWTSWSWRFIRAKVLRTGETPSDTNAFVRRVWRQPSANFLVPQKLGYSVRTLWTHTCLILPLVRSGCLHEKRFSRPRSSKELYKREINDWASAERNLFIYAEREFIAQNEKNWNPKNRMIMRVKKMTIEQGRRAGLNRFPNFHKTGSVRGMKRLYYGNKCLLVRCGDYIYNVSSEPQVYHQATN